MTRIEIINYLIEKHQFGSYLELNHSKQHHDQIIADKKVSVGLNAGADHVMSTDDYFLTNKAKYNIVFVNTHESSMCFTDIFNALDRLKKGGIVVVANLKPTLEAEQTVPYGGQVLWTGDAWKAWVQTRQHYQGSKQMYVVDTDWGVGVIADGESPKLTIKGDIDFNGYEKNQEKWLNLISVEQFKTL